MESHREAADQAEQEADRLEQESERLSGHIEETRRDWEAKKGDESVPGAQPAEDEATEEEDTPEAAQSEEGESAGEAGQ